MPRKNGARGHTLVEPTILTREYGVQWRRTEISLCELAKLRKGGWSIKQMATHYGVCSTSIEVRIRELKKKGLL
ncbi:MAG: hypothetical protein KBD78_13160 [Oligoflexales bacterium]|nr:hypothetical protein [Oligoflexales bacterium]